MSSHSIIHSSRYLTCQSHPFISIIIPASLYSFVYFSSTNTRLSLLATLHLLLITLTTRLLPEYTPIPVLLFSLLVCCSQSRSLFVDSCCWSNNRSTPRHTFTRSIRSLYCLYFFVACCAFLRTSTTITLLYALYSPVFVLQSVALIHDKATVSICILFWWLLVHDTRATCWPSPLFIRLPHFTLVRSVLFTRNLSLYAPMEYSRCLLTNLYSYCH